MEAGAEYEELQEIAREMRELEKRGEVLEKELRQVIQEEVDGVTPKVSENADTAKGRQAEEHMLEWINLIFKKRSLTFKEEQLRIRENGKKLDYLGNLVDHALRKYLDRSDKSTTDLEHEQWLLQEWLKVVQERDNLVMKEESLRVESELMNLKLGSPTPLPTPAPASRISPAGNRRPSATPSSSSSNSNCVIL